MAHLPKEKELQCNDFHRLLTCVSLNESVYGQGVSCWGQTQLYYVAMHITGIDMFNELHMISAEGSKEIDTLLVHSVWFFLC